MIAQRLAINFNPPVFTVEYRVNQNERDKHSIRYRRIYLKNLDEDTSADDITDHLLRKHADVLNHVNGEQIRRLCHEIISNQQSEIIESINDLMSVNDSVERDNLKLPVTYLDDSNDLFEALKQKVAGVNISDKEVDHSDKHTLEKYSNDPDESIDIAMNELSAKILRSNNQARAKPNKSSLQLNKYHVDDQIQVRALQQFSLTKSMKIDEYKDCTIRKAHSKKRVGFDGMQEMKLLPSDNYVDGDLKLFEDKDCERDKLEEYKTSPTDERDDDVAGVFLKNISSDIYKEDCLCYERDCTRSSETGPNIKLPADTDSSNIDDKNGYSSDDFECINDSNSDRSGIEQHENHKSESHDKDCSIKNQQPLSDNDLNKVSEEELAQAKLVMNVEFEKNQVFPSDKRYEYDKRGDFEAEMNSSWD